MREPTAQQTSRRAVPASRANFPLGQSRAEFKDWVFTYHLWSSFHDESLQRNTRARREDDVICSISCRCRPLPHVSAVSLCLAAAAVPPLGAEAFPPEAVTPAVLCGCCCCCCCRWASCCCFCCCCWASCCCFCCVLLGVLLLFLLLLLGVLLLLLLLLPLSVLLLFLLLLLGVLLLLLLLSAAGRLCCCCFCCLCCCGVLLLFAVAAAVRRSVVQLLLAEEQSPAAPPCGPAPDTG